MESIKKRKEQSNFESTKYMICDAAGFFKPVIWSVKTVETIADIMSHRRIFAQCGTL